MCTITAFLCSLHSWGSGADLWGSDNDNRFEKPQMDDGLLEVVGVTGVVHMVSQYKIYFVFVCLIPRSTRNYGYSFIQLVLSTYIQKTSFKTGLVCKMRQLEDFES